MEFQKVTENLKKRKFCVSCFETGSQAADYINARLTGRTIGFGGSITVESLGLFEKLSEHNQVYWHWKQPADEARKNAADAQVYISSANAVSETGEIINIDGTGNRVASLTYGHEEVYVIIGKNKLAKNYESAMKRARNVAAPLNAKRLKRDTPCAAGDEMKCYDCSSPERICSIFSVLTEKPGGIKKMEVIIINEDLGF